jgi:tetratricopeptide (TPR) repeat protein
VRVFPTVLFFDSKGEEIDRICGWSGDKEDYFQQILDYVSGKNTLGNILNEIEKDSNDVKLNYQLAMKYVSRWEGEHSKPYFERILALDPEDKYGYQEETKCYLAVYEIRFNKNPLPILNFLNKSNNEELLELGYSNVIRFYNNEKNQEKLLETFEKVVTLFSQNSSYLNQYAWYIYENKISDRYDRGIELARAAVEIKPESAGIWDTLSWLLFANGEINEAIECMEKAAELDPDQDYYRDNLKKMKASIT